MVSFKILIKKNVYHIFLEKTEPPRLNLPFSVNDFTFKFGQQLNLNALAGKGIK